MSEHSRRGRQSTNRNTREVKSPTLSDKDKDLKSKEKEKKIKDSSGILKGQQTMMAHVSKTVTFMEGSETNKGGDKTNGGSINNKYIENEVRKVMKEELSALRQERYEFEKIRIETMNKNLEMCERFDKLENKLERVEEDIKELRESFDHLTAQVVPSSIASTNVSVNGMNEASYNSSHLSRTRSVWSMQSGMTGTSVCLSEREVVQMKKMLNIKDKNERRENIVIKGLEVMENESLTEQIHNFLEKYLNIQVDIVSTWRRGKVIIAKIYNFEQRELIMKNKNKLKGTKVFIENDLSFDDRKRQEEIVKWAKVQREKGVDIKVGLGKVFSNGTWLKWEEIKAKHGSDFRNEISVAEVDNNKEKDQNGDF